jgi:hypothetical protein
LGDTLREIREGECRLVADAERALYEGHLGVRGAGLYNALSTALDALMGVASCRWGCHADGHLVEKLVRRFTNACLGALRLSWAGYNDEALALVRVAAEVLNLIQLFDRKATLRAEWLTLDAPTRRKRFSPAAVRDMLVSEGVEAAFDRTSYQALCEAGVHVTPESAERSHDLETERLTVGPNVSIPAMLLVWTELGYASGELLRLTCISARLAPEAAERASTATVAIRAAIGQGELRMVNYDEVQSWFRKHIAS